MRNPFRRRPAPELELNEDAFDRWIRAQRPPFELFLTWPEEVQEALAQRGDAYVEDIATLYGYAVLDPERTRLGLAAEEGDEDVEAELTLLNAKTLAAAMSRVAQNAPQAPAPASPLSFGGIGKRRQERQETRQIAKEDEGFVPTLFGKKPDQELTG